MGRWQRLHKGSSIAIVIVMGNGNLFFQGLGIDTARSLADAGEAILTADRWARQRGHYCEKSGCRGWRCTKRR
jgi:hypothetical protein